MNGLKPDTFREEMYSRTFENLDDVVREAREELSTYREILKISDLPAETMWASVGRWKNLLITSFF